MGLRLTFCQAVTRVLERVARPFQDRVDDWNAEITKDDPTDIPERRARFLEEALELVQSLGMSASDAHALVRYTFGRPVGVPFQEFGGTSVCLNALATYASVSLDEAQEAELMRVWEPEVMTKIRGKRTSRHGRGPLPGAGIPTTDELVRELDELIAANKAATRWGAAVGARHDRIQEIDRELARRG